MNSQSQMLKKFVWIVFMSCAVVLISGCVQFDRTGKIVFATNRDGNYEIYVMTADGSSTPQRLTNNPNDDNTPVWSPDGTRIAFTRTFSPTGFTQDVLMIINADGTHEHQLTVGDNSHRVFNPIWSSDGSHIAFQSGYVAPTSASFQIYIINADGTGLKQIAPSGFYPNWSPDGSRIAYNAATGQTGTPTTGIYVVFANGTGAQLITTGGYHPTWSPTGSRIAFVTSIGLYAISPAGSGLQSLASTGSISSVRWSLSEKLIAYVHAVGSSNEIRLIDTASLSDTLVATGTQPVWSPLNHTLAFVSDRTGNNEIYLVNEDGVGLIQLTNNTADDTSPDWHP